MGSKVREPRSREGGLSRGLLSNYNYVVLDIEILIHHREFTI